MKPQVFTPEELEPILRIASECGMILVGGQAIGSWATLLENPEEEPWKSQRPYTSRDADELCTEIQMLRFAKALSQSGWSVEVFEPNKDEMRLNTGAVRIEGMIGGTRRVLEMNLLKQLDCMSNQEIEETSMEIPIHQSPVRTMDTLRLLESKIISLNTLDQIGRQDRKHLILCCAAVGKLLLETGKGPDWPNAIKSAQRIIQNAYSQIGLDTLRHFQINLLDSIPWNGWRQSIQPELRGFGEQEQPHRNEITSMLREIDETKQWLASLQPKIRGKTTTKEPPGSPA